MLEDKEDTSDVGLRMSDLRDQMSEIRCQRGRGKKKEGIQFRLPSVLSLLMFIITL